MYTSGMGNNAAKWSGQEYREARVAAGLTRQQVATSLCTTETSVYRWETGRQTPHEIFQKALWKVIEKCRAQAVGQ